ncbi:hypothetical protein [Streptomyces sp. NPDC048350]|uniref:hypothetical protein n=1 Tax=Streptomyces sp. NPDC048350 TaxID=3365538 RepID=UPI003720393D
MNAVTPVKRQPTTCLQCGADVEQKAGPGRLKRFCTPWEGRVWRQRMAALGLL